MTARPVFTESANTVANGKTGATSFTAGALIFGNGTSALATDDANLHWDNTNNGLAIGTNTLPSTSHNLHVAGQARIMALDITDSGSEVYLSSVGGAATAYGTAKGLYFVTAGAGNVNGYAGNINFVGGNADAGSGGNVSIQAGQSNTGQGGGFSFQSGAGGSAGGSMSVVLGAAVDANGTGGSGQFDGGSALGVNGVGGTLVFTGGAAINTGGVGGDLYLVPGAGGATDGSLYICDINAPLIQVSTLKLGFFGATPVVQPTSTTDIKDGLCNLGLLTNGGATPLNLDGGAFTAARAALTAASAGTAGTAPIKVTSGTLLSAAEAGAIEFNTDNYYLTGTTGTQRKTVQDYAYRAITALRTLDGSDELVNCTSGTFTVTLPTAVGFTKEFTVKNSGTGLITLATTSSQTVDGALTHTLLQYACITVRSNGTNWIITSRM